MKGQRTPRLLGQPRTGLTAVELLVAATLAALLMVSILGLLTTIERALPGIDAKHHSRALGATVG